MSFLEKLKNKKIKIVVGITVVSSLLIGVYYLHNKKSNTINSEENYVETYTIADNEKIFRSSGLCSLHSCGNTTFKNGRQDAAFSICRAHPYGRYNLFTDIYAAVQYGNGFTCPKETS